MNWFGGDLLVDLTNGATVRISNVRFNEYDIAAALEANVRPGMAVSAMYHPYPTTVEITDKLRAVAHYTALAEEAKRL